MKFSELTMGQAFIVPYGEGITRVLVKTGVVAARELFVRSGGVNLGEPFNFGSSSPHSSDDVFILNGIHVEDMVG